MIGSWKLLLNNSNYINTRRKLEKLFNMADQIKISSVEGPAPKIPKRIEQIEMTTAEGPAQNIFRQNFNFFGKPVPLKTTFFIQHWPSRTYTSQQYEEYTYKE